MPRAKKSAEAEIFVKVARTGSKSIEVSLGGDRTVHAALKAAGLSKKESEGISVNGEEVDDLEMVLEDGDRLVLVKNIEGGTK